MGANVAARQLRSKWPAKSPIVTRTATAQGSSPGLSLLQLGELVGKEIPCQIRIALHGFRVLVPRLRHHLHHRPVCLEQARRGLMARVVKTEMNHTVLCPCSI